MPAVSPRQKWVLWALGVYAVMAAVLLLSPIGPSDALHAVSAWLGDSLGIETFHQGWIEVPLNVLLFAPLGFLLTLLFRHAWIGAGIAIVLSIGAELVQTLLPARLASLRDVIANALGALIGAGIAWLFLIIRRRSERRRATTRAR